MTTGPSSASASATQTQPSPSYLVHAYHLLITEPEQLCKAAETYLVNVAAQDQHSAVIVMRLHTSLPSTTAQFPFMYMCRLLRDQLVIGK